MAGINSVVLIGRLARDPELRVTPNGVSVANITLAVDRPPGKDGSKQADFIDCVLFGQTADATCKYLSKGKMAAVEGRIQVRSYETKGGDRRKAVEVVANNIQFLSPRERSDE